MFWEWLTTQNLILARATDCPVAEFYVGVFRGTFFTEHFLNEKRTIL